MKTSILILFPLFLATGLHLKESPDHPGYRIKERSIPFIVSASPGKKYHSLQFIDLQNNTVNIDFTGSKCCVINLWGVWCKPCVAEIPTLNKLLMEYRDRNIEFYALSSIEDSVLTKHFLETHPFNFKQVLASREFIRKTMSVAAFPTTLFIDGSGIVRFKIVGGQIEDEKQSLTVIKFRKGMVKMGCP